MIGLHMLTNTSRIKKNRKRVGRGPASGTGKTSGRGMNGAGSRSGYKRRYGTEGGNLPLYRKLPCRGFTRGRFKRDIDVVNLWQIEEYFQDNEEVNAETLYKHGCVSSTCDSIKILGNGELSKKVIIKISAISEGAQKKLEKAGISFTILG